MSVCLRCSGPVRREGAARCSPCAKRHHQVERQRRMYNAAEPVLVGAVLTEMGLSVDCSRPTDAQLRAWLAGEEG